MGNQLYRGRVSIKNQIYHITSCTNNRQPLFLNFDVARLVIKEMEKSHTNNLLLSLAWVVMPDHIHWLFQLSSDMPLSKVIQQFKARSAIRIHKSGQFTAQKIWQKGFHDHAIRKEDNIRNIARYIIANPLRAGLVDKIEKYSHWDAIWLNPME